MSNAVSELQLLEYENALPIATSIATSSATSPSNTSLLDNINNYLSGADTWLQNINNEINPFNVASNLAGSAANALESNPYLIGLDNMFYSLPGVSSIYQAALGNTSIGLGGTIIPNTPSTPSNTPTTLAKTIGTVTGNVVAGAAGAAETAVNAAIGSALKNVIPGSENWNWSLIILAIVAAIILIIIVK